MSGPQGGGPGGGGGTITNDGTFAEETGGNLAAILAKLSADPATQTTLAAVLAKLTSDPATQTTLAAILAKLVAAPALEGGNLATIAARLAALFDSRAPVTLAGTPVIVSVVPIAGWQIFSGAGIAFTWSGRNSAGASATQMIFDSTSQPVTGTQPLVQSASATSNGALAAVIGYSATGCKVSTGYMAIWSLTQDTYTATAAAGGVGFALKGG